MEGDRFKVSEKSQGAPRGFGEQGNITIYFKGTMDSFGTNLAEQGTSLLLKGTLTKKVNKGGRVKFLRDIHINFLLVPTPWVNV